MHDLNTIQRLNREASVKQVSLTPEVLAIGEEGLRLLKVKADLLPPRNLSEVCALLGVNLHHLDDSRLKRGHARIVAQLGGSVFRQEPLDLNAGGQPIENLHDFRQILERALETAQTVLEVSREHGRNDSIAIWVEAGL